MPEIKIVWKSERTNTSLVCVQLFIQQTWSGLYTQAYSTEGCGQLEPAGGETVKRADLLLAGRRGSLDAVDRVSIVPPPQVAKRRDRRRPVVALRSPGAYDDWGQLAEADPLAGDRRRDR